MKSRLLRSAGRSLPRRAFTLIELLVVIAIIAILAAILFPVFATVREQARQGSAMSSMHSVYLAARTFYEDEGRYPTALFGFAETPDASFTLPDPQARPYTGAGGEAITPMSAAQNAFVTNAGTAYKGINHGYLYREQVKDYNTFLNPDNPVRNQSQVTVAYYPATSPYKPGQMVTWEASGTTKDANGCRLIGDRDLPNASYVGKPKYFYVMDSMDIGPVLNSDGTAVRNADGSPRYELHYTPDWTHQLCDSGNDQYTDSKGVVSVATQQLKYRNPPTDRTVLTYVTQHVATAGSSNILVLLASGTARKINVRQYGILPLDYGKY